MAIVSPMAVGESGRQAGGRFENRQSGCQAVVYVNGSDLMPPDWRFLEPLCGDPGIGWQFHSGLPRNRLEKAIRRPNFARYRAGVAAARAAARLERAVLVSHMPRMGAAMNVARRAFCPEVPQIAFSFTFTDLPTGADRIVMSRALQGVHEFVVFSEYERQLYADHFGQPVERMHHLPWGMDAPVPGDTNPVGEPGSYLCAAGGEGRDYRLLAEAMRARPRERLVIIARPHSLSGISFPENVRLLTNLPWPEFWRIVADSAGLVVPLRNEKTTCGRLTMVGAQMLGVPIAITRSDWMAEYVPSTEFAHLFPAGDRRALVDALAALVEDPEGARAMAGRALALVRARNGLDRWVQYFRELSSRLTLAPG